MNLHPHPDETIAAMLRQCPCCKIPGALTFDMHKRRTTCREGCGYVRAWPTRGEPTPQRAM